MEQNITAKTLYGITTRASNNKPHLFAETWQAFLQDYEADNHVLYAVYSRYESDFTGDFDFSVAGEKTADGLSEVEIPAGRYHVFDTGLFDPMQICTAWEEIWKSNRKRSYKTDFEVYKKGETIKIFLSIL